MFNKCRPIGVFDSGMGGLSVWQALRRELPEESLVYLADGKNCPYGNKPASEVACHVGHAIEELVKRNVKLIVVACNTATAVAIDQMRAKYPSIPFVGMEPAVKPAALTTKSGTIGILATRAALAGDLFKHTCANYSDKVRIISAIGEGFVEAVEEGLENNADTEMLIRRAVEPMLLAGADKIVLGCTHYPFLAKQIDKVIGPRDVELINPAPAVARRAAWLLDQHDIAAPAGHKPEYSFVTFADDAYLARITDKAMMLAQEEE